MDRAIVLCGLLHSEPAVTTVASVPLCQHHVDLLSVIVSERHAQAYRRTEPRRSRVLELVCPCGKTFLQRTRQGATPKYCPSCRASDSYHIRQRRKLAAQSVILST